MATLGLMWPLDRTMNMLSMFTFIMTLGIIVDDAIVVGEHSATVFKEEQPLNMQLSEGHLGCQSQFLLQV